MEVLQTVMLLGGALVGMGLMLLIFVAWFVYFIGVFDES